jgi:predicted aspartyl protease
MSRAGHYSRRNLLGQGAAALALAPSLGRAAAAAEGQAPPAAAGETIQGDADPEHRLTIDTMIDGKGPFRFLVDTGADRTVIADNVAIKLGLISGEDVVVQGISRSVVAATVGLKNVTFGRDVIANLAAPILPRTWLGADGYFGLDVVDGRRVTFDFVNHKLTIDQALESPDWLRYNESVVRANGSSGRLTSFNCSVDGVHAVAFIDSGAEMTIGNTHLFAELEKSGAAYVSNVTIPVIGVTGGIAPGRLTATSNVRIGTINFRNGYLIISDLPVFDIWGLADRPALFLGMNFLKQTSSVSIDFARKQMRFRVSDLRLASRA